MLILIPDTRPWIAWAGCAKCDIGKHYCNPVWIDLPANVIICAQCAAKELNIIGFDPRFHDDKQGKLGFK